eukprot:1157194-Pelagomonas_calceolata.AAC.11
MDGLAHSHIFKQKLLNCEPVDLNRFVVDLRIRHLQFLEPFSNTLAFHWALYQAGGMKRRGAESHCYLSTYDKIFLINYFALFHAYAFPVTTFE